ncbi:MAG: phosphotransferase [candidate division Zixibacteria bacterium]|nr:phosphotransferase [candidate division Zixibacteria bacterium]
MGATSNGAWPAAILPAAARRFGVPNNTLRVIGGFENYLGEGRLDGLPIVLRIARADRRSPEMLQAEFHWIRYLADRGVPAARPIPSPEGALIERIEVDGVSYHVSAFERAPGKSLDVNEFSDNLVRHWGALVGRMHASGTDYRPTFREGIRPMWDEDPDIAQPEQYLPPDQTAVRDRVVEYRTELRSWSTQPDCFGMIHSDLHPSNFHVHRDTIMIFDFDDCRYEWYASEIASILFFVLLDSPGGESPVVFGRRFLGTFLAGYRMEKAIEDLWLKRIPVLLKFREVSQYIGVYRTCDMNHLNEWRRRFLSGRRESIENQTPMIDFDPSEIY